jgi:integrase
MKLEITISEAKEIFKSLDQDPEQLFEMIRFDLQQAVQQYLDAMMRAGLTHWLGREPYARGGSEVLGLRWSDVDFQKKQIQIRRTFDQGRFSTPKTKGSARRIDLAPTLIRELASRKLKSGEKEEDLVFPNEAGQPLNYSNMVQR